MFVRPNHLPDDSGDVERSSSAGWRLDFGKTGRKLETSRTPRVIPTEPYKPIIFISYANEDEPDQAAEGAVRWLSFVTGYLRPAVRHGAVEIWIDTLIRGGVDWDLEIERKLRECDIFVLLVSRHSMSSDYVLEKEIAIIRDRQAMGEDVHFYPLVLTPTPKIALAVVRDKNLRPRDGKPFSEYSLHDRERHMSDAADEIAEIAGQIAARNRGAGQTTRSTESSTSARKRGAERTTKSTESSASDEKSASLKANPSAPVDGVFGFSPDSTAASYGPDILEIGADARALARLMCLEGASPLAIAVLGGWGSGKSSFMERLDREVRKIVRPRDLPAPDDAGPKEARVIERVVQVRFNAWQFVDANLWASLTAEFFDQLRAGGWDRQTDARYASLVERVNRHVHALNADLDAKRKIASKSAKNADVAQKSRDQAVADAKLSGGLVALDELKALYDTQKNNLSALGIAIVGDDTTESVEAVLKALRASRSIYRQILLIISMFMRDRARLRATLALALVLVVLGVLILQFGRWSQVVAVLSWVGAAGTLAVGLMPALRFVGSVTKHGAEIAQKVDKADRAATAKLLEREIKLRDAIKETQALEAAAEEASKRVARYVDPLSRANPPRLLRYVLEDDPDTQALESQLGLIGRTRRLFQAVDDIVRTEKTKPPNERVENVPDRVIIYIDDLDRCSEEQVYNVLQAIHLLLAFELFVVVVGVDIARVTTALVKFAAGLGEADANHSRRHRAAQYLDKIFQIAFWLSPLTTAGDDGGSYARYVKSLAMPTQDGSDARQGTARVSSVDQSARGSAPPGSDATAAGVTELPTNDPKVRGFATIALEPEEVIFLASDAIGRLAANTPRSVKRLVNSYRLVRTRLGETGDSIMGAGGAPPLYPLIALMVALETGESTEIADDFYHGLNASSPTDSLNTVLTLATPENAPTSIQPLATALSTSETLRNALTEVISARAGTLSIGELRRVARVARRFSFNQPR